MKAICRYTGLDLISSSGFARWATLNTHPIFSAKLEDLLTLAASEWSPEMFVMDKKLLMLAIADNCKLLAWDKHDTAVAIPSPSTVESAISPLLTIASWIDYQRSVNKLHEYPRLLISSETAEMHEFPILLREIIATRDLTDKEERKARRIIHLEEQARVLSSKCTIGANKEKALLETTARWALMVTEAALKRECVGEDTQAYWLKLLVTSPNAIKKLYFGTFNVDERKQDVKETAVRSLLVDLQDLRDFMVDNLPHGSVIAHDVVAHLTRLVTTSSYDDIDGGTILGARMLTTGSLVSSVEEPKRTDFANVVEYARARAVWLVVSTQKQETASELKRLSHIAAASMRGGDEDDI